MPMVERFVGGECVYSQQGLHGALNIFQNNEYRWLCYGGDVVHSCMLRAQPGQLVLPYQHYMAAWQLFFSQLPPTSALLLGVGGGDSIRFLQQYYPHMVIQAVEQDALVLRLACEWFALKPEADKLELIVQEAGDFMLRHKLQHDLIMIDMLAGESMPACLYDDAFWASCYRSLSEQGLLLVNGIFANSDEFMLFMKQLQACFGRLPLCMKVPGYNNVLIIVGRQVLPTDMSLLMRRAESIASDSKQDFSEVLEVLRGDNPGVG